MGMPLQVRSAGFLGLEVDLDGELPFTLHDKRLLIQAFQLLPRDRVCRCNYQSRLLSTDHMTVLLADEKSG